MNGTYVAIDLKSFYASVECIDRGLDPLTANLVVADESRTDKTICLAVSPSLKAYGIPGRARLFEVKQKLKQVRAATGQDVDFIIAEPHMQHYMDVSAEIYHIYLKYISPSDIHVYSIDEVFMDIKPYLSTYRKPDGSPMTVRELTKMVLKDVLAQTGITATAGIGTNLYLAKIAMDIVAKHVPADADGVRIAELDETSFKKFLWGHRPLTSFWRIGSGIARRLESNGMYTMGDVARMSLYHEDFLFQLFGIDAELLIDHAWGVETCTMQDIKSYRPESNSLGSGQVLACSYSKEKARLVIQEMVDSLVLELVEKGLVTDQVVLDIGYDRDSADYSGPVHMDRYGRRLPKPAHGSTKLNAYTSSTMEIMREALKLFDRIISPGLPVRRLNVTFLNVIDEAKAKENTFVQYNLFTDPLQSEQHERELEKERKLQHTMLNIKEKYGKNAILKGMNLEEGATAMERNRQIGGHKA